LNFNTSNHRTKHSAYNDEDDLRSLQRQLQNFPSLNELKSSPLTSWTPQPNSSFAKANETRASIRSAGSSNHRGNLDDSCPLSINSDQEKIDDTETFALAALNILKVLTSLHITFDVEFVR